MPHDKDIDRKAVEKDYYGGMKYKELADKYGVSLNTVKSWKQRYNWSRPAKESMHTKANQVCATQKSMHTNANKPLPDLPEAEELTDRERLFCEIFDRNHNATQAYIKAYGCSWDTAHRSAYKLSARVGVKRYLAALRKERRELYNLQPEDIVERMMQIAFGDIGNYLQFGQREEDVMGPYGPVKVEDADGNKRILKKNVNFIDVNASDYVDTALIQEISQGRDGIKIKLGNNVEALKWLMSYFEWNPTDKHKKEFDEKKLQLEQQRLDLAKQQAEKQDAPPQVQDLSGILEALKPQQPLNKIFGPEDKANDEE